MHMNERHRNLNGDKCVFARAQSVSVQLQICQPCVGVHPECQRISVRVCAQYVT